MKTSEYDESSPCMLQELRIDIDFHDVSHVVDNIIFGKNVILDSLSGSFASGQLSAIIGPSGGGKSTLLNILSGLTEAGGDILFNGEKIPRKDVKTFSALIMQDDVIHRNLTVMEIMIIAGKLKLGNQLTLQGITERADSILKTLLLDTCRDTRTEKLSGGERRRLCVALEIIDNPRVVFVDEPTTGLDTVSAKQIVSLLRLLARQGRTVICTIHQPSALLFEQFDHVYVLSKGKCVYQGTQDQLVPFLAEAGCVCPVTHNPADFVLDCIYNDSKDNTQILSDKIKNGKLSRNRNKETKIEQFKDVTKVKDVAHSSFIMQTFILLRMMMTQKIRNKGLVYMSILNIFWCCGQIIIAFYRTGFDGNFTLYNLHLSVIVIVLLQYTYCMTNWAEIYPQFEWLERNHFNRWFTSHSYFLALNLSSIPQNMIIGIAATLAIFIGTNQELTAERFSWFFLFAMLGGLIAEAIGRTVTFIFSQTSSMFVGCVVLLIPAAFVGIFHKDKFLWMSELSFTKMAMNGIILSLLEGKEAQPCSKGYESPSCAFRDFRVLWKYFGSTDRSKFELFYALFAMYCICIVVGYFVIHFRLNSVLFRKIESFLMKLFETLGIVPH